MPRPSASAKSARKSEPEERLTTDEVATLLNVTPQRVRQWKLAQRLVPDRNKPFPLYTRESVTRFQEKRYVPPPAGPPPEPVFQRTAVDKALQAFACFAEGHTLEMVVEKLRIPPAKVRALYREWSTPLEEPKTVTARDLAAVRAAEARREARAKEARAIDAEYDARMKELDKDAVRIKRRTFEFSPKGRTKRRAESDARVAALKARIEG